MLPWQFPSKIVAGHERPEPIPRENREEEENTCDFDDNDSSSNKASAHGSRNSDEEPHNSYAIKTWGLANKVPGIS